MTGADVEVDLLFAESNEDEDIVEFCRGLLAEIDENDWSKNMLITLIVMLEQEHLLSKQVGAKRAPSAAKEFS